MQHDPVDDRQILPIIFPFNDLDSKLTQDWRLPISKKQGFRHILCNSCILVLIYATCLHVAYWAI